MSRYRYRVVITGAGVHIPSADGDAPITAFATTRFVRAGNEQEAAALALASVQAGWSSQPALASSPAPRLTVVFLERVRSPFKRSRPNGGHTFVETEEELPEAVALEQEASSGWFL